jgi:outer membrane protein OmpA-like peptidoglycan-associated protein/tetratricopeptide (TPR) repeat protein
MKKLILFVFIVVMGVSYGQNENVPFNKDTFLNNKEGFKNAVNEIELGDVHFYRGSESDLANALTHYLKADNFNHYSTNLNYKIGVCFLNSLQKFKSLDYLKFAYEKAPEDIKYDDIDFYLGQAYHLNENWDKAIEHYREYKDEVASKDKSLAFYVNKKMGECRTGQKLSDNPIRVWVENLGSEVNSEYSDFGPVISADNRVLFFTSRRPDTEGGTIDEKGEYFEDIYVSKRQFDGDWLKAENIGSPVNTELHDATIGLAPDGKSLLTYHGVSKNDGNILITKQNADKSWQQTADINGDVNTKYHETAATLSFDEKTLFFISDKPGGFGKHDIYTAQWDDENKVWGKSENVGATLNTEFDEKGVFFHTDNKTLYFSSQGHKTMGGLDIFKSEYNSETKEWSRPVNIGSPINTPDDDVYFVMTGNERYAYYSSFRADGLGEKDIYKITFLGEEKQPMLAYVDGVDNEINTDLKSDGLFMNKTLVMFKGVVVDGNSKEGLKTTVSIINANTNEKIANVNTDENGNYMQVVEAGNEYAISTSLLGYTIASKRIKTDKLDSGAEIESNLELYPPVEGGEFVLRNIYFGFDKLDLIDQSVEELDKLVIILNENPSLKIELGGHTDRRGPSGYNLKLSQRRANIAKDYLIRKKIDANRVLAKGYGETRPEVSGETINNLGDFKEKEEAHQQNRRTIVTIISK